MPPLPDEIKKLLSALQAVVENDSFRTTLKDTLEVAKEIDDLKATKRTQDRERFDLEMQLDKWQRGNKRLREQLALSQAGLQKGTETVNGLKNELRIEKENNKAGLQSLTTAAKAAERRVKQLEGYMTSLQAVSPENIERQFGALFQDACKLTVTHFGGDFGGDMQAQKHWWKALRGHLVVKDRIPLPFNSPSARNMRMAAFLAVLAFELSTHVFLPTYLLEQPTKLCDFLSDLAGTQPPLEAHLRSVLLKAQSEQDREAKANRQVETAVQSIIACAPFPEGPKKETFRTELKTLCQKACRLWLHMQSLNEMVVTDYDMDELDCWKPLDFSSPPLADQPSAASSGSGSGNAATKAAKKAQAASDRQPRPERAVWLRLLAKGAEEEILTDGYALSEGHIKKANEEEKAEAERGSRRESRRKSRAASASENAGDPRASFLSSDGGDGQVGS